MKPTARAEPAAPVAAASGAGEVSDHAARLVPLEPGFYAISLAGAGRTAAAAGLALPAVHVCAPPDRDALDITDDSGRPGAWLGGPHTMLFVKSPPGGAVALVTGFLARDPDADPLDVEIRRIDGDAGTAPDGAHRDANLPPVAVLRLGGPVAPQASEQPVGLDVIAHIRGRGDVRFVDAPWIGRLAPGEWIEAFTIVSRSRAVAAAIEYKGLTASGDETPWVACGAPCGTRGRNIPLVGFAIRQKAAPGGAQFDCEYAGCFQSGATAGPARNGAPCLSPRPNDPLEGMQLRITPRRPRPAPPPG